VKTQVTQRNTSARIIAAVSALVAVAAAAGAHADTISVGNYTPIFQGVSEAGATVNGQFATVLQINLDAPGISFTTSPLCSGCTATAGANVITKETAAQFLTSTGVAVAITANTYINNDGLPTKSSESGLQVSNGTLVNPDQSGFGDLLISQNNQATFAAGGTVSSLAGVYNAIAGQQGLVLTSGTNTGSASSGAANRAGVGLSQNGQFMYLVDVDNVSLNSEANLFEALGAYNAINTDGGASAELEVSNGNGGATNLNNSGTKDIGADLGIYARPLAPVPLPAAVWLFGSGLLSLMGFGRRRVST
jgi:Phosphodiester glycosidase